MAHPVDVAVGNRVRELRIRSGMTQQTLAEKVGVSFQQVQKYEKGANRMGASRLIQVASILNVPVSALFQDIDNDGAAVEPLDRDAAKVARDWRAINDDKTRQVMRDVIRALSKAG
ncbi:MAG: helix-turn-helix transcriptional regulator [Marivibrio sp.]|uniref:helix-turn-helix domain-containing protein n=1 Tax=Marivibrio sp. TaxID=2039719 RepID=UPI0032ED85D1